MNPRMVGNEEAFREALGQQAASWSVPCETGQLECITRYAALLLTWTARINLTGAVSLEDLLGAHLPDSFALASRLGDAGKVKAIDIGSGGGLPGLPLAILCPNMIVRLVEPIAKKAAFLRTAVRELGLGDRVSIDTHRAQTLVPTDFDVALSRATLPPRSWLPLAVDLVRPGGRVFLLASATADWSALPSGLTTTGQWPYLAGRRWLVELVKAHS